MRRIKLMNVLKVISDAGISALRIGLLVSIVSAQTGVLVSTTSNKPDPKVLSLAAMYVDIFIEDQNADVRVVQIFDNHSKDTLEGRYLFALPSEASVADFAVWDGVKRVPGVMMEKRRANEMYEQIKSRLIDPGILQQDDEHGGDSAFSAKIFPIRANGTKRLEMEYTEVLSVEDLNVDFTFPLKPAFGEVQSVGDLRIKLHVLNSHAISPRTSDAYPFRTVNRTENEYTGEYTGRNVELTQDLSFGYKLNVEKSELSFIAHRSPEVISAYDLRDPKGAEKARDGFFRAEAIFGPAAPADDQDPRDIVLMLDTSLSMYGDKLRRAVEGIEFLVGSLRTKDRFSLILFDDEIRKFREGPVEGSAKNKELAIRFVKDSVLGGGTNLRQALSIASLESRKFKGSGKPRVVMISDANSTTETVRTAAIAGSFGPADGRLFAFGVGSDTNVSLLGELAARTNGYYVQVRETEDISVRLQQFLKRVLAPAIDSLAFSTSDPSNLYDIYATERTAAAGSGFAYVGRYRKPGKQTVTISASTGKQALDLSASADLPESEPDHGFLPRVWAKARISALLQIMNISGEREDLIAEIISLSEKYKIVTPYTAFIAAPRALLRPRLIQPGDPVIRIRTDESVTEVFAVLPFGETLPLRYLKEENIWQTRFLAPVWMQDGTYFCRLLLRDRNGNVYEEKKSFVIDSRSPKVRLLLPKNEFSAGENVKLRVMADKDTNRITARIYGAAAIPLRWSSSDKANTGTLGIPSDLASGNYVITVTAEDFAHNQTTEEYTVAIRGKLR